MSDRRIRWTVEDDQRLLKLKAAGKHAYAIAKELKRRKWQQPAELSFSSSAKSKAASVGVLFK
jgi:hypothetical protein